MAARFPIIAILCALISTQGCAMSDGGSLTSAQEQVEIADMHHRNGELEKASILYEKAANHGLAEAQYKLARMYHGNIRTSQDEARVYMLYEKAAHQGVAGAQYHLGKLYYNKYTLGGMSFENTTSEQYAEAIGWIRAAADQGHAKALGYLGFLYHGGYGVPEDDVQAYMYYSLSADRGNKEAGRNRGTLAADMSQNEIAKAQKQASEWAENK